MSVTHASAQPSVRVFRATDGTPAAIAAAFLEQATDTAYGPFGPIHQSMLVIP